MKNKSILIAALLVTRVLKPMHKSIWRKGIGSPAKGAAGLIFSDADAAALSKTAVDKMDSEHIMLDLMIPTL
jgi:putative metalloprotease